MNNKPVAWMLTLPDGTHDWILDGNGCEGYIPLYTSPRTHDLGIADAIGFERGYKAATAKELTDEEILIEAKYQPNLGYYLACEYDVLDFARAILRKAQEK
jgi:hypothetical protein